MDAKEIKQKDWGWFHDSDIESSIRTCRELLGADFLAKTVPRAVQRACITLFLVHLSDLLQKANAEGSRVSFSDHIDEASKEADVTALVTSARNAACHVSSGIHKMESSKLAFLMVRGYSPTAIRIKDRTFGCEFEDDFAFLFGSKKIYFVRHLIRALEEVSKYFETRIEREKHAYIMALHEQFESQRK